MMGSHTVPSEHECLGSALISYRLARLFAGFVETNILKPGEGLLPTASFN
jgi:hypothetical protein